MERAFPASKTKNKDYSIKFSYSKASGLNHETRTATKPLLRVLDGEVVSPPPIWLMRQAGRYLPEYRRLRAEAVSFLDFCYSPRLAAEATLQPIRRFGFDAAILFSDILVVPDALGQKVGFEENVGPRLEPIESEADFASLAETIDLAKLAPVFETIERVKTTLPGETALIGFCGAPWTVATYMVAGRGTSDQAPARLFAYRHRELFQRLIDRLVQASIEYLTRQIDAGCEAVQIFDTWAGVLPPGELERWCIAPVSAIVSGLRARHRNARVIGFPKGIGHRVREYVEHTRVDALGLDSAADPGWVNSRLESGIALQGNLDPLALLAGGPSLEEAVPPIIAGFATRPHIFNLGHGILPATPLEHVTRLVELVRQEARG